MRILVVEDEQEIRDAIESLLKSEGYLIDPARSKDQPVKRTGPNRPDLILVSLDGPAVRVVNTPKERRKRSVRIFTLRRRTISIN